MTSEDDESPLAKRYKIDATSDLETSPNLTETSFERFAFLRMTIQSRFLYFQYSARY